MATVTSKFGIKLPYALCVYMYYVIIVGDVIIMLLSNIMCVGDDCVGVHEQR